MERMKSGGVSHVTGSPVPPLRACARDADNTDSRHMRHASGTEAADQLGAVISIRVPADAMPAIEAAAARDQVSVSECCRQIILAAVK